MRLIKARVRMYHDIGDTGEFEIYNGKPFLPGVPRARRLLIIDALQRLNPPSELQGFDTFRDYPRSEFDDDIMRGNVFPSDVTVAEGHFALEPRDLENDHDAWLSKYTYVFGRTLDNKWWHRIDGSPGLPTFGEYKQNILCLCLHAESRKSDGDRSPSELLNAFSSLWTDRTVIDGSRAEALFNWICNLRPLIELETDYHSLWDELKFNAVMATVYSDALDLLRDQLPVGQLGLLDNN